MQQKKCNGEKPEIGDEIEIMEVLLKGLKGIFKREITEKERVLILLNYVSYQGQLIIEKKKLKKVLNPYSPYQTQKSLNMGNTSL